MVNSVPPNYFRRFMNVLLALFFACFLLAGLLLPATSAQASSIAYISGRVTNRLGEPMVGVIVTPYMSRIVGTENMVSWQAINAVGTDENGYYRVGTSWTGNHRLLFMMNRGDFNKYLPEWYSDAYILQDAQDILIEGNEELTGYDVVMDKPGHVVGTVVNSAGEGIPDVLVQGIADSGITGPEVIYRTVSDINGRFAMTGSPSRQFGYYFQPSSGPYMSEYYNNEFDRYYNGDLITVPAESVVSITIQLDPRPYIYGTVTDKQGRPVPDSELALHYAGSPERFNSYVKSDANGYYIMYPRPGSFASYQLEARGFTHLGAWYNEQETQATQDTAEILEFIDDFAPREANLVVTRVGYVTGTVTGMDGNPVPDVEVRFMYYKDTNWREREFTYTDSLGNYGLFVRPGYEYRVRFSKDAYITKYYGDAPHPEDGQVVTVPVEIYVPNINTQLEMTSTVIANFRAISSWNGPSGPRDLFVKFYNYSWGGIIGQIWDFGDGTGSTEFKPTHTYTKTGVYTVSLTVIGNSYTDTSTKVGYVTVTDPPIEVTPTEVPPTEVPPTAVPPTAVPPTEVPPTEVPPTEAPPTEVPPTAVTPTEVPPTEVPPTAAPPTEVPPTEVPPTEVPLTEVLPTAAPPTEVPPTDVPPTEVPPTAVPPTAAPPTEVPPTEVPPTEVPPIEETSSGTPTPVVLTEPNPVNAVKAIDALTMHTPPKAFAHFSLALQASVVAGDDVSYTWDFGDGTSGSGPAVYHTYVAPGNYVITLTAWNGVSEEIVTHEVVVAYALRLPQLAR